MEVDERWYGDFNVRHRVSNLGTSNRIHLTLDCVRNIWSDELLKKLAMLLG